MTTNFHQEQLPCGCLPVYRRCEYAEKLRMQIDSLWRENKHKNQRDPVWLEYDRLNDEYLQHIQLEPVARIREVENV
jgi:hypothetical protein